MRHQLNRAEVPDTGKRTRIDMLRAVHIARIDMLRAVYIALCLLLCTQRASKSTETGSSWVTFNTNNSTFCPHSVFMCFVWISEQTAIISLYSIN